MANVKISNLSTVWTSSLTEHDGIKITVTDVASSGSSKLINLLIGDSSKFSVGKNGVARAEIFMGSFTGSLEGTSSRAISASYANFSSNATTASSAVSSSAALYSISGSRSEFTNHSISSTSSSFAEAAQFAEYSATSGHSSTSTSASYALISGATVSSSYALSGSRSLTAISASYALNAGALETGSTHNITASWARSASFVEAAVGTLVTGSTHNITSSWANKVVSSSYAISSSHAVTASFAQRYAPFWPSNVEISGSGLTAGSGIYSGKSFVVTSASFTLIANSLGNHPQYYNWYINSSSLVQSGSSNSLLIIQSQKISNSGHYTCNVTNSYGSATSQNFIVQVLDPAVIIAENPPTSTPPINSIVTFNVAATGDLLEYAWRRTSSTSYTVDGVPNVFTNGSLTPTLTIQALASVPPAGTEGSYACEISNPISETSSSEMVIYTSSPTIVNQPLDMSGTGVTSITATGSAISYSWEYGGVGITGQTSHTMSLTPAVLDGYLTQDMLDTNDDFRCRVYNGVGQVVSNTFKIIPFKNTTIPVYTVGEIMRATAAPTLMVNCDAQMIRPSDTTFNWTRNGVSVGSDIGAHGQSLPYLTLYNVQPGDAGTYICSCSYNGSSSMSDSAVVTVTANENTHNTTFGTLRIFPDETVQLIGDFYYNLANIFGVEVGPGSYKISSAWRNIAYGLSSFDPHTSEFYIPCDGTLDFTTVPNVFKTSAFNLIGSMITGSSTVWKYQYFAKATGSDCPSPVAALPDPFPLTSLDGVGTQPWVGAILATDGLLVTAIKIPLPVITVDMPTSTSVTLGDSVSLSVTATGSELEYRWYRNGIRRGEYATNTYLIGSAGFVDSGSYVCIVGSRSTHDYRTDTSITARLDVSLS